MNICFKNKIEFKCSCVNHSNPGNKNINFRYNVILTDEDNKIILCCTKCQKMTKINKNILTDECLNRINEKFKNGYKFEFV